MIRPGEIWPDDSGVHINAHGGGILLHDGVYYWCGEHKIAGDAGNYAQVGVHVYSSRDLTNWRDEGIGLGVSDDPESDITRGCILERPKVIFNPRTGKFVMWFHIEFKGRGYSTARAGVAIADHATGPYRYIESIRPSAGVWPVNISDDLKKPLSAEEFAALRANGKSATVQRERPEDLVLRRDFAGGQMARDMTLFVDDDGIAYHIAASEENATLHFTQLDDDYLRPTGRYARVLPGDSNEAPAIFKHGGKYFMISSGCTGWNPNPARSAVADSIWGPWTPLGNPCIGPEETIRTTFDSQSTYVLPLPGHSGAFIFMADRWRPANPIDGRYVWLPIIWRDGKPTVEWMDEWDLSFFDRK